MIDLTEVKSRNKNDKAPVGVLGQTEFILRFVGVGMQRIQHIHTVMNSKQPPG
jgi:hypothetical protein